MQRYAPGIGAYMKSRELLGNYDYNQSEMMEESCIRVNSNDEVVGPVSKFQAHRDEGILHRAFSVLIVVLIFFPTGFLGKPDIEKV